MGGRRLRNLTEASGAFEGSGGGGGGECEGTWGFIPRLCGEVWALNLGPLLYSPYLHYAY